MNLKLNIAYNKTTKQLIGYSNPKSGYSILVTAYAVDDLEKKFNKAVKKSQEALILTGKTISLEKPKKKSYSSYTEKLYNKDQDETDMMINNN